MNRKRRDERRLKALELLRKLEQEFGGLENVPANNTNLIKARELMNYETKKPKPKKKKKGVKKEWFLSPNYKANNCPRVIHITQKHCKADKKTVYELYRTIVDNRLDIKEAGDKLNLTSNKTSIAYSWGYKAVYSIDFRGEILWSTGVRNFEKIIRSKGYSVPHGSVGKYDLKKHIYIADVELVKGA